MPHNPFHGPNQQTRGRPTSPSHGGLALPPALIQALQALMAGRQGQAQAPGRQVSRVPAPIPPRLAELMQGWEPPRTLPAFYPRNFPEIVTPEQQAFIDALPLTQAAKNEQMRQQLFGANPVVRAGGESAADVLGWMNPQNVHMPGYSVLEETEPQSRTRQLPITPRYEDPLNRSGTMQAKQQYLGDAYTLQGPNTPPQDRALTMGGIKLGEQVAKGAPPRQIITKPRVIRKKRQMGMGGEGDTE